MKDNGYEAFISYRHVDPDRRWARWLHRSLETYRTPASLVKRSGLARRLRPVFRDEEELAASADLSGAIDSALVQSRYLIVVCSPRTPESRWIDKEVARFRELGRGERILALLIEGAPKDAFPQSLREVRQDVLRVADGTGVGEQEPLAADVRDLLVDSPRRRKRTARLRLLATILGCSFDDLRRRELERYVRRAVCAGIGLGVLLLVLAFLTAFALRERTKAERAAADATHSLRQNYQETGRRLLLSGAPGEAAVYLSRAYQDAPRDPVLRFLVAQAARQLKPLVSLTGFRDSVASAHYSPDGRWVLGVEEPNEEGDNQCILWDAESGEVVRRWRGDVVSACFASRGSRVAIVLRAEPARLCDPASGALLAELDVSSGANFSADGSLLATWATEGERRAIRVWNAETGEPGATVHCLTDEFVEDVRFCAGGTRLLSFGHGNAWIRNVRTGSVVASLELLSYPAPACDRSGRILVGVATEDRLGVWRTSTGRPMGAARMGGPVVGRPTVDATGRHVATAHDRGIVRLWNVGAAGVREAGVLTHSSDVAHLEFGPDSRSLLAGTVDGSATIWDVRSKTVLTVLRGHEGGADGAAFSSDGAKVATLGRDRTAKLWDTGSGALLSTIGELGPIRVFHIRPDRRRYVESLEFHPSAARVMTTTVDRNIQIWDARGQTPIDLPLPKDMVPAKTGSNVVRVDRGGNAELWDPAGTRRIAWLHHDGFVLGWAINRRQTRVATVGEDRVAKIWDAATGRLIAVAEGHRTWLRHAAFAGGDPRLATAGGDRTVRLWDARTGHLLAVIPSGPGDLAWLRFSADDRAILACVDGRLRSWPVPLETRAPLEVGRLVAEWSAYVLRDGVLVPKPARAVR